MRKLVLILMLSCVSVTTFAAKSGQYLIDSGTYNEVFEPFNPQPDQGYRMGWSQIGQLPGTLIYDGTTVQFKGGSSTPPDRIPMVFPVEGAISTVQWTNQWGGISLLQVDSTQNDEISVEYYIMYQIFINGESLDVNGFVAVSYKFSR